MLKFYKEIGFFFNKKNTERGMGGQNCKKLEGRRDCKKPTGSLCQFHYHNMANESYLDPILRVIIQYSRNTIKMYYLLSHKW